MRTSSSSDATRRRGLPRETPAHVPSPPSFSGYSLLFLSQYHRRGDPIGRITGGGRAREVVTSSLSSFLSSPALVLLDLAAPLVYTCCDVTRICLRLGRHASVLPNVAVSCSLPFLHHRQVSTVSGLSLTWERFNSPDPGRAICQRIIYAGYLRLNLPHRSLYALEILRVAWSCDNCT